MSTTVHTIYRLRMFMNVAKSGLDLGGWSEEVNLTAATYEDALADAADLVPYRAWLLPADCTILYARIAKVGAPRDSAKVNGAYPIVGKASTITTPPAKDKVGDPDDCLLVRFQCVVGAGLTTEQAKFSNYFIHGIPVSLIEDRDLVDNAGDVAVVSVTAPAAFPGTTPATYAAAVAAYLAGLWSVSSHYSALPDTVGPTVIHNWAVDPWTGVSLEGATSHKIGRPFRLRRGRAILR